MRGLGYFRYIDFFHRVATKKSGAAVDAFLKKIQQTMGVAIVGVAVYRNEEGKLCTFEYVILLDVVYLINIKLSHRFCTEDSRKNTFPKVHSKEVEQLHVKWGKWVSQKGTAHLFYIFQFLILLLGADGIEPNELSDGDEGLDELANNSWMGLLDVDDDGYYSLKPLEDIKANKVNLGKALRQIMRQAWGECHLTVDVHSLNLIFII